MSDLIPRIDWEALGSKRINKEWLLDAIIDRRGGLLDGDALAFPELEDVVVNSTEVDEFCLELMKSGQYQQAAMMGCERWQEYIDELLSETEPETFRGSLWIQMARNAPRLGNTRDISVLVNGSPEESDEYLRGLKAMAICSWTFFALWAVILIYCKCFRKGGVLAGTPPLSPEEKRAVQKRKESVSSLFSRFWPSKKEAEGQEANHESSSTPIEALPSGGENDEPLPEVSGEARTAKEEEAGVPDDTSVVPLSEVVDYTEALQKYNNQVRRSRICVLVCIPLIWVFSGLLIGKGFVSLHDALISGQESLPVIQNVVDLMHNGTSMYLEVAEQVKQGQIEVVDALLDCPFSGDTVEKIRDALPSQFEFEIIENITLPANISEALLEFNETITNVTTFTEIMIEVDKMVNRTSKLLNTGTEALETVSELWYYPVTVFVLVIDAIVFLFGVKVLFLMHNKPSKGFSKCIRIQFPIFVLLIFVSYLISTYCMIVSEMLGDLCIVTPDNQVKSIVEAGPPFNQYLEWYTGGCRPQDQPLGTHDVVLSAAGQIARKINLFFQLLVDVSESTVATQLCNGNIAILQRATNALALSVSLLLKIATEAVILLTSCDTVYGLYVSILYTTACDNAVRATAQIYAYLFPLAVLCMILISLRAAWYEDTRKELTFEDEENDLVLDQEIPKSGADVPEDGSGPPVDDKESKL